MGEKHNLWENHQQWPVPNIQQKTMKISSSGKANSSNGDGVLSWEDDKDVKASTETDSFTYDPNNPIPTNGGCIIANGLRLKFLRNFRHSYGREKPSST
jgi:hypothetical protein